MSRRNVIWLVAIVAIAIIGSIVFDAVLLGVLIGLAGLVVSEIVERARRRRLAAASGESAPRPLRNAIKRSPQRKA
ncbi:MAG: hypothetical protein HKN41_10870 [Ilumatobacter sp.]|nr:hypothetical protein [Ilumatobacter sp.]